MKIIIEVTLPDEDEDQGNGMDVAMRSFFLKLADRTDTFIDRTEKVSRILAILAIAGAVVFILIPAVIKLIERG